jgi:outer membrane immunogenic protein
MRGFIVGMLAGIALGAMSPQIAAAADLPLKAPPMPMPVPVSNWTGFYIGGNVGYLVQSHTSGLTNFTQPAAVTSNPAPESSSSNAFTGGFQVGYNWQIAPRWVIGVEGDWNWTDPSNGFCRGTDASLMCSDNGRGFLNFSEKTNWLATARGRIGWVWNTSFMFYGTAGGAWGQVDTTLMASCAVAGCGNSGATNITTAAFSNTASGWAAGLGAEALLGRNWIARVEWLHYDLGTLTTAFTAPAALGAYGVSWSRQLTFDTFKVGLNYKFDWFLR